MLLHVVIWCQASLSLSGRITSPLDQYCTQGSISDLKLILHLACAFFFLGDELEYIRPNLYRNIARQLNISLHSETVVTDAFLAVATQIFSSGVVLQSSGGGKGQNKVFKHRHVLGQSAGWGLFGKGFWLEAAGNGDLTHDLTQSHQYFLLFHFTRWTDAYAFLCSFFPRKES